jgi:hypothetical protein
MKESIRKRRLRFFAGAGVVSLLAGLLGMAGMAAISGTAFADTPTYNVTCTGVPVLGTLTLPATTDGTATPNPAPAGGTVTLEGLKVVLSVPASLVGAAIALGDGGKSIAVSAQSSISVTNGTPTSISETFSGSATIPSTKEAITVDLSPSTPNPTVTAGSSGTVSFSTTADVSTTVTLAGSAFPAFSCTEPVEEISSAAIEVLPTLVPSASSYNIPATGSTEVDVTGANWPDDITSGSLKWSSGTDTGTFTTNSSGDLTGSIKLSKAGEQGTNTAPFSDTIEASATVSGKTYTASATVTLVPVVALPYECTTSALSPASGKTLTCTVKQEMSVTVSGEPDSIFELKTNKYGTLVANTHVTLSPITLSGEPHTSKGSLNEVWVFSTNGTLAGWTVTGEMEHNFHNTTPHGNADDNVISVSKYFKWTPSVTNKPLFTKTGRSSEVKAGSAQDLSTTTPHRLCYAPPGGGGGFFGCGAALDLTVQPWVAAGTYTATMDIVLTVL